MQAHRAALAVCIFHVCVLGEMFKTVLEQNYSMKSAEVELPASISALDPLEMSNVLVVKSNIFHTPVLC